MRLAACRRRRAAARLRASRAAATAATSRSGSSSTSTLAPASTVSDPLGRRAQRHARHAVPVRLLLQAARVGDDHPRLRGERGEVEVAERLGRRGRAARARRAARPRTRVGREDDRLLEPVQARRRSARAARGARSPRGGRSRAGSGRARRRSARARRERSRAIGAKPDAGVAPSRRRRPRCGRRRPRARACRASARPGRAGASATRSTSIRFRSSGIERSPLRRPASTCATGTPAATRRARAGERRVGVAEDERRSPAARASSAARDPRLHRVRVGGVQVEPVPGSGRLELVEEDLARAPGRSAAPCGGRPRRSRARAARPRAAPT